MSSRIEAQREMARIALSRTVEAGFALAGSGAIREHGVIDRPTEDIDLFTMTQDDDEFARAVDHVVADLRENGYEVEEALRVARFARLKVFTAEGHQLNIDMGVDWRENDPVQLDIGPVLSVGVIHDPFFRCSHRARSLAIWSVSRPRRGSQHTVARVSKLADASRCEQPWRRHGDPR